MKYHVDFIEEGLVTGPIDCDKRNQSQEHVKDCPWHGFLTTNCRCPLAGRDDPKVFLVPMSAKLVKIYSTALSPVVYTLIVEVGDRHTKIPYGKEETPDIDTSKYQINAKIGEKIRLHTLKEVQFPVVTLVFDSEKEP